MVVEYLLLIVISSMILLGSFGLNTGPIKMFKDKSPYLAKKVENRITTGGGFVKHSWKKPD